MRQRTLLRLLACLAPATCAFGQSSVTIFGTVDLNATYSKAGDRSAKALDQGGYLIPSRIGFRGTEDLGDGLFAGFWLESAVLPDTGSIQGNFFGRRSTLSLGSRTLGELRIGRDYVPTFWNISSFSPFGTVGVAGSANIIEGWPLGIGAGRTLTRASNSIEYFLPSGLGGLYGQAMVAASEGQSGAKYTGARLGYEAGPLNVALAYGRTPTPASPYTIATLGGSYDFKVVKGYVNYLQHKLGDDKQTNVMVGAMVPVGLAQLKISYARSNRSGVGVGGDDASQIGLGVGYSMSKRTTLYGAYSHVANKGNAAYVVADSSPDGVAGKASSGIQVGIRHDY